MMLSRLGNSILSKGSAAASLIAQSTSQQCQQQNARGMATLKEIRNRLKSVRNIEKITKSMKMVSAAKFARAERNLRDARVFGDSIRTLSEKVQIEKRNQANPPANPLFVVISSDRGLCGAIHSSVSKKIKAGLNEMGPAAQNARLVIAGDKARTILQRTHANLILMHFAELGKRPPTFDESSLMAQEILKSGFKYDGGKIVYNHFKSVISYEQREIPIINFEALADSAEITTYEVEDDILQNYQEFNLATSIFYAQMEGSASELSSRMSAMDNASKNAGEMIGKLTLSFNRTRQAVITGELIEILSGAAALT